MKQPPFSGRILLGIICLLGWFALITQMYLNLNSNVASTSEIIVRYFSYFTLDTNLIVAVCCTFILLGSSTYMGKFFLKPGVQTAIAIYILVVGLIYNTILRFLWAPQGLPKVLDELEHTVIPILFVCYWFLFVSKQTLQWKQIFPWLIYPFVYAVFVLIRGSIASPHFYPYPFIDVDKLGWQSAIINAFGITAVFLFISILFIAIAKWMNKRKNSI